jgi:hypothetical protein
MDESIEPQLSEAGVASPDARRGVVHGLSQQREAWRQNNWSTNSFKMGVIGNGVQ